MFRNLIFLLIFSISLFAKVDVSLELLKNDENITLENNDIVFEYDKLKFNIKSNNDEVIEIFYKTNDNQFKYLDKIQIKKDELVTFPQSNEYIILDDESGTLTFLFKTQTFQKELILNTNPKI